jgi:hypothetical protein
MAVHYNFRNILDIDPDNEPFTCVGMDESCSTPKRCQKQIILKDRKAASRILDEMNASSNSDKTLKSLPELVFRTLCAETHRSKPECCQVGQVYTEWKDIIRDHWTLVRRESSKGAFERWRFRKVKGNLESMRTMMEDENENQVRADLKIHHFIINSWALDFSNGHWRLHRSSPRLHSRYRPREPIPFTPHPRQTSPCGQTKHLRKLHSILSYLWINKILPLTKLAPLDIDCRVTITTKAANMAGG